MPLTCSDMLELQRHKDDGFALTPASDIGTHDIGSIL